MSWRRSPEQPNCCERSAQTHVWPPTPRFLGWRWTGRTLELAITEAPPVDWLLFGPFASGVVFLPAALVRLLWHALNPAFVSITLPQGWLHGRMGAIATIEADHSEVDLLLTKLFEGETEGFVAWITERTMSLAKAYDLEMRDADLETVTKFIQAKARRSLPFAAPDQRATEVKREREGILPFVGEDWQQP